jgi:very-short-patch-repair endonuclease
MGFTLQGQTNNPIRSGRLQRALRRSMTDAERKLWTALRGRQMHGLKFRRQHPFEDCIPDFVCLEAKIVIEVDGGHHAVQSAADEHRTERLKRAGFRVLRFWNNQVLNEFDAVRQKIWDELSTNPSPP